MIKTQSLGFSEALSSSIKKIFQFSGRARRSEYWWAILVINAVGLITIFLGQIAEFLAYAYRLDFLILVGWVLRCHVTLLVCLLAIPPTFRRLHDTGRSGWWWGAGAIIQGFLLFIALTVDKYLEYRSAEMFIAKAWGFLFLIWIVILLVFLCTDSDAYENDYGESSKYIEESQDCV